MTPFRLGFRAAAQGMEENPFDFKTQPAKHDEWVNGAALVKSYRKEGLDPRGHQPPMPHLCARASKANPAVCNCCDNCKAVCQLEGVVDKINTAPRFVRVIAKTVLKKIFG